MQTFFNQPFIINLITCVTTHILYEKLHSEKFYGKKQPQPVIDSIYRKRRSKTEKLMHH